MGLSFTTLKKYMYYNVLVIQWLCFLKWTFLVLKHSGIPNKKMMHRMNDIGLSEMANNVLNMTPLFCEKNEGLFSYIKHFCNATTTYLGVKCTTCTLF